MYLMLLPRRRIVTVTAVSSVESLSYLDRALLMKSDPKWRRLPTDIVPMYREPCGIRLAIGAPKADPRQRKCVS